MSTSLLLLADGRFPTGGHAHSAGVEAAVAQGDVSDLASLERFLRGRLATTGVVEAAFSVAARSAVVDAPDPAGLAVRLARLDAELDARILSSRAREVSRRLGRQFTRAARTAWPDDRLGLLAGPPGPHQAIATGLVVGVVGGSTDDAARLPMHHLAAAVTSAAVRLLALDPMEAARLQVAVGPLVDELVAAAPEWAAAAPSTLPADGGALSEILAEHHGTWPARLFVG